jgi:hypothetical protein
MARRSGLASKVTGDVIRRFVGVKALWFAVNNDPEHSLQDLAVEFYSAVGQLLEGISVEQVELHKISRERVLRHIKEG